MIFIKLFVEKSTQSNTRTCFNSYRVRTENLLVREWYNGSIVAFQAIDPGSTPGSRNLFIKICCCCCCWSPSSSTMTLHCYEVLPVLSWDRMWLRSPKSEAQTLLHLGHRGPVFGFVEIVWRAARPSSEVVIQPFTKLLRPVAQTVFHISLSLARASSRSLGLMLQLRRLALMRSMKRFFGRPTERCPTVSSP